MLRKNIKARKGQIFSLDMIFAVLTFISIIVIVGILWDYGEEKISQNEKRKDVELIADNIASVLVETAGKPVAWSLFSGNDFNENNIFSLGLSANNTRGLDFAGNNNLDGRKIAILDNSSYYNTTKRIYGLLGPNYNFYLIISKYNGTAYNTTYTIGEIPENATNIVVKNRYALVDGLWAKIQLKIWEIS